MTVRDFHKSAAAGSVAGCLKALAGEALHMVFHAWAMAQDVYQRHQNRQGVRDMLTLDDHILRDIGVTRYDVQRAGNLPLNHRAGEELTVMSGRRRQSRRRF